MNSKFAMCSIVIGALLAPVTTIAAGTDMSAPPPESSIRPELSVPGDPETDAAIAAKIKAVFVNDRWVDGIGIKVDASNGGVVGLSGTATSRKIADRAVSLARNVDGVVEVESRIKISPDRGSM
jgi:hypothetical protein